MNESILREELSPSAYQRHHSYHPRAAGRYTMTTPEQLPEILRASAQEPDGGGIVCGAQQWSPAQIEESSDGLCQRLQCSGVQAGDRVVVLLPNSIEFVVACFAVWKAGAIFVPLDRSTKSSGLSRILRGCRPTAIIVDREGHGQRRGRNRDLLSVRVVIVIGDGAADFLPGCNVESFDDAIRIAGPSTSRNAATTENVSIHYTSGSTGEAKGVMHSHESWLAGVRFTRDYHAVSGDDSMIIAFPLHHAYAFRHLLTYVLAGGTVILTADIYEALRLLKEHRPSALLLVPSACSIILDHFRPVLKPASSFLRYVEIGTAPLPPQRLDSLTELLPATQVHLPYGLTEARVGFLERGSEGMLNRIASVAPGLDVHVVDGHGQRAKAGETGQIALRGAGLMKGYWGQSSEALEKLRVEGFLTGDMGRVDEQGNIELLGRIDDMINVGGRKVSPVEVEAVLRRHTSLDDVAVMGLPDPHGIMGDAIHAFLVPRPDAFLTEPEILDYCQTHLENHKVPSHFHLRESLPKSPLGKTLRPELAAMDYYEW